MKNPDIGKKSLALHKKHQGKFAITSKTPLKDMKDLALVYTPGVGAVSSFVAKNKAETRNYTMKGNSVAVVSDGSAVLGLGNIGPEGALPVMEGKALLFKKFANIDAVPIVLATQDVEEIIKVVKAIAPGFGGINLEDFAAPKCFEIEERLKSELDIPVMHDDQHGTAVVVLAGLLNALKVVGKKLNKVKIVVSGAGAAGTAFIKLALLAGAKDVVVVDRMGVIYKTRKDLSPEKVKLAAITNPNNEMGRIAEALEDADVFVGVSAPGLLTKEMVKVMAKGSIVFGLANPIPEIMPDEAFAGGARVVATGRSDFPNQLNNALVFPGIFRGALDNKVRMITDKMKLRAAYALAGLIPKPTAQKIVPTIFDPRLVRAISKVIK